MVAMILDQGAPIELIAFSPALKATSDAGGSVTGEDERER
jgi:hypothetical protein